MDSKSMKVIVSLGVCVAVVAAMAFAEPVDGFKGTVAPWRQVIGTNAVKVCPDRNVTTANEYATNTAYAQGAVVLRSTVNRYYMAVTSGTSGTNSPAHMSCDTSDGGVTWRAYPGGPRNGLWLYNSGTNDISIGIGYRGTATQGGVLRPEGTVYIDNANVQVAVYAIATVTNAVLQGLEF